MEKTSIYLKALATGKVLLRKAWKNLNAKAGSQISLQFQQVIEVAQEGTNNALVAFAQAMDGIGENRPTAIFSMSEEVFKGLNIPVPAGFYEGTVSAEFWDPGVDYSEGKAGAKDLSLGIFANDIFPSEVRRGLDINIQVIENFEKNPLATKQTPKQNPRTNEVLKKGGLPIYRHTSIIMGAAEHQLIQHDRVPSLAPAAKVSTSFAGVAGQPE